MSIPKDAAAKLAELVNAADEADALARLNSHKIGGLQKNIGLIQDYEQAANVQTEIDRLNEARQGHQRRARELAGLVANINHWLSTLRADVVLETVKPPLVKLLRGESLPDAVKRIRDEIGNAHQELRTVRLARPPIGDLKAKLKKTVDALAMNGRPKVTVRNGELVIDFRDPASFTAGLSPDRVPAILAWLDPAAMVERLGTEIDALPKTGLALSETDKAERIAELTDMIARLEHVEEAMIAQAHSQGQVIERREKASPAIVLGVTVKAKQRVQAA